MLKNKLQGGKNKIKKDKREVRGGGEGRMWGDDRGQGEKKG